MGRELGNAKCHRRIDISLGQMVAVEEATRRPRKNRSKEEEEVEEEKEMRLT